MSARSERVPSKTPWLDGFEETDYSKFWETKRIEDEAQKKVVRGMIRPGGACLDLGGGFGRMTKVLEPYFREVVLMDLTRRNLGTAKDTLSKAELVRSDVSAIPARDSYFDSVVMIRVVHLLPRPLETMKEIQRISKDGAVLIISVPNLVTNYMIREFDAKVLPGIRHVRPTFGPAVWPVGDKPRLSPHELFIPSRFRLTERRGTGMFDNFMGKALNRFPWLHLIDVATSPLWYFKLDVFLRFEVRK